MNEQNGENGNKDNGGGNGNEIVNAIFRVLIGLAIAYGAYQLIEIFFGRLI